MLYRSIGSRHVGQSDGATETLILFGIIISETDLEFDSFDELSFLSILEHFSNGLLKEFRGDLAAIMLTK